MRIYLMNPVRAALALTMLATLGGTAVGQQKQPPSQPPPRVIIIDPNFNRPPPMPMDRQYVGPAPATAPPMERIPPVAPLSQPPPR
jgi:hypothetical protein